MVVGWCSHARAVRPPPILATVAVAEDDFRRRGLFHHAFVAAFPLRQLLLSLRARYHTVLLRATHQVNKHIHIYAGWFAYVAGLVQCYRGLELVAGSENLIFSAADISFTVREARCSMFSGPLLSWQRPPLLLRWTYRKRLLSRKGKVAPPRSKASCTPVLPDRPCRSLVVLRSNFDTEPEAPTVSVCSWSFAPLERLYTVLRVRANPPPPRPFVQLGKFKVVQGTLFPIWLGVVLPFFFVLEFLKQFRRVSRVAVSDEARWLRIERLLLPLPRESACVRPFWHHHPP